MCTSSSRSAPYDSYWNNDQDFHSEIQPENYEGMSPDYGYDFLDHTTRLNAEDYMAFVHWRQDDKKLNHSD